MGDTFIVDMRHYLDDSGEIPDIPGPALNLALFFGAIVGWVTSHSGHVTWTNVPCRRSPGRRRCRGDILASFDADSGGIVWECPLCDDRGFIHGWEGTQWDRRPRPPDRFISDST
jgi:hypothetical protein